MPRRSIKPGMMLILSAGLAGCAQSSGDYRLVSTPGPRGTVRAVRVNPVPEASTRPCRAPTARTGPRRYRFVTTPGPRGMTRLVRIREPEASTSGEARRPCE